MRQLLYLSVHLLLLLVLFSCAGSPQEQKSEESEVFGNSADPAKATYPQIDHDGDGIIDSEDDDDDNDGFSDEHEEASGSDPLNYFDRPEETEY